jgi:hypothetical protein
MPNKKDVTCALCDDLPYLGGLCKKHYGEWVARDKRRRVALDALFTCSVDGKLLVTPQFRNELRRLSKWWDIICDVRNSRRGRKEMPIDEADAAGEWCIILCQEIIDADRAKQNGSPINYEYYRDHEWVWERLKNLKAGRRSNGLPKES